MLLASPFRTPSTPRKRSNAVRTPTTTPPEEHAHKRHQTPRGVEITATRSGRVIATTKELIDGVVITKSRAVTDNELEIELSQERRTSRSESPTTERKVSEADNTLPDEDGTDNADTAAASHVPIKPCSVCKVEIPDEICTFKNCESCCMNRERPCKPHLNKNELTTK